MHASELTTESARDPQDIGLPAPRFGWTPTGTGLQTAYQLAVSTAPPELPATSWPTADMWDSGLAESDACSAIRYRGSPLRSRSQYVWQVRLRDDEGRLSAWSPPAVFHTTLLSPSDWSASWVAAPSTEQHLPPNPLLRYELDVDAPVTSARLYVCALGYGVGYVNGSRIGDQVLVTPVTKYDTRVQFATYDVGAQLREGRNTLAFALGRGFYASGVPERFGWHAEPYCDEPKLLAQLEIEHPAGTPTVVATGPGWQATEGPTTFDAVYAGESYDARREPTGWTSPGFAGAWPAAVVTTPPDGGLEPVVTEPIRVVREVQAKEVNEVGGRYVVDFGEVVAGWVRMRANAPRGTRVSLRYGEVLGDDGLLERATTYGTGDHPPLDERFQVDEYTFAGTGVEEWQPQFTYKGFRYVEVAGLPTPPDLTTFTAAVVHTDAARTSQFHSSSDLYTWVHDAMQVTTLNNLHGLPTDTPMYEKCGWLGDAHVAADAMLYCLDLRRTLDKWLRDIADSQLADGSLPSVAPVPNSRGFARWGDSPAWTGAFCYLMRRFWECYGDLSVTAEHYPALHRHLDYLLDVSDDGLVTDWWGDWASPGYPEQPPEDRRLAGTAYLYKQLHDAAALAAALDEDADAQRFRADAGRVATRFNDVFLDPAAGCYLTSTDDGYRQTSNALALAFDLVPAEQRDAVVTSLVADIRVRDGHLNTGVLGTSVLFDVLSDHGHVDLAHTVASRRTPPGYGTWYEGGTRTLWERWEGYRSRDHYFFGSVVAWYIGRVAGISPAAPGYRRVLVNPDSRGRLDHAGATLQTVRGTAACSWRADGDALHLDVEIPGGAEGEVHLPDDTVEVVGSGHHTFAVSLPRAPHAPRR